ncbi:MAG: cytochrome c biogenesis protein CcdA [Dehalococcoidia bacterium]|nr:cytochrome c biogenesis protein CcdA [Dehalococcoidia bacterium]
MQTELSLLMALGGGLLSFLSPCVLPLVPAYFGSLAGPEVFELQTRKLRLPVFLHSVVFVAGFSVIFVGLGALVGWAGFNFSSQLIARRIAGSLLVAFGVYMLLAIKIPWLNFEKRILPGKNTRTGYLRSLLIGAVFAFAWTPCASPILGGILALALDSATTLQGAYLLGVYSIGIGIPFLAIGIAFDFLLPLVRQINKYTLYVYLVSGLLLITAGVLTLTR